MKLGYTTMNTPADIGPRAIARERRLRLDLDR